LQHAKKQLVAKEKSSRDNQKAYTKDQSVVEGLCKELSAIEVGVVYGIIMLTSVSRQPLTSWVIRKIERES